MFVTRTGLVVAAVAAFAGLCGCATTTRVNLSNAAQNLEYDANALVHDSGAATAKSQSR